MTDWKANWRMGSEDLVWGAWRWRTARCACHFQAPVATLTAEVQGETHRAGLFCI